MTQQRIVVVAYDGPVRNPDSAYVQNYDSDGNETTRNHEVRYNPSGLAWPSSAAFTSLQALYNSGVRLYFFDGENYYLDSTSAELESGFSALPSKKWLLEYHPFNPLRDFEVNQHDSLAGFPAVGFANALELKRNPDERRKEPWAWDADTGKYWAVGHNSVPTSLREDYAYLANQHVNLRRPSGEGTNAGQPQPGVQPVDLVAPTDPDIPVERMVVRDIAYNFSGLVANEDVKVVVGANLTVVHDAGTDDAAWSDGQSGQPTHYQFQIALAIVDPNDLTDFTLIESIEASGVVVGGATNVRGLKFDRHLVTVPSGKMIRLACVASQATSENRYSRGFTVRSGELQVSLFEDPDVPVEINEVTAFSEVESTGDTSPQTVTFDFDTPVDLQTYNKARFYFDYARDRTFQLQETFDLREVPMVADAAAAQAGAIDTDYEKHLWVVFYSNQRALRAFLNRPWDGWYDYQVATRFVFFGSANRINGCSMKVFRNNVGATVNQTLRISK